MLEEEEDVLVRPLPVDLQGQGRQSGAVAVVAALVPHSGDRGDIGGIQLVRHRHSVEVRPEGHAGPVSPGPVGRVEPAPLVYDIQTAGVLPQEVHQMRLGPALMVGQLRVGVERMAELHRLLQVPLVHPSPLPHQKYLQGASSRAAAVRMSGYDKCRRR